MTDTFEILSPIQRQIAHLVAEGFSDKQIAALVGLSPKTIDYHLKRISAMWSLRPDRDRQIQIAVRVARSA